MTGDIHTASWYQMKELFQRCFAVFLAVCIVNPACCCSFSEDSEACAVSSCCGGGGQDEAPDHECGCVKMTAVADWKAKEAIQCNSFELPAFAGYEMVFFTTSLEATKFENNYPGWIDTSPPARRRAWLQSFLL